MTHPRDRAQQQHAHPGKALHCRLRLSRGDLDLNVTATFAAGRVTAILGPSGAGKTTWLRAIAGLEREARGLCRLNGEIWQDSEAGIFVPPHRRAVGYVFQDAALFPHMTVRDNLRFGMRHRAQRTGAHMDFDEIVTTLALAPLLDRRPPTLSGGEAQRVAIARALLSAPEVLLFDEPLSAVDEAARRRILDLLENLCRHTAVPVLYVSHNRAEVARLADHVLLMEKGRIRMQGPVTEIFARLDVALDAGSDAAAVVEATVSDRDEAWNLSRLTFSGGTFLVAGIERPTGARIRLRVLARDVSLTLERQKDTSILNIFPATVTDLAQNGPAGMLIRLDVGGTPLLSAITRKSAHTLNLHPGRKVFAQVKAVALID